MPLSESRCATIETMKPRFAFLLPLLLVSCANAPDASEGTSSSDSEASSSQTKTSSESPAAKDDPCAEPHFGRQYYLNHIGDICSTWQQYRGEGTTIAVIDVGFNPEHEDFYFKDGTSKVSNQSAAFQVEGNQVKTTVGLAAITDLGESHGTFCAGVAAAAVNGKGVVGVAPEASLLLLRTDAKPKAIAKAMHYAADHQATAISISIGSYYDYKGDLKDDGSDLGTVFDEPVAYCRSKGVPVISAAGNGGLDGMPTEYTFPGCVDGVIGVGGLAANSSQLIWSGSSYNYNSESSFCDVFVNADMMYGCCHYGGKTYDGGWNGTSFAAPQVAGMAALYFQKNPGKSVDDFEKDLYASCTKVDSYNPGMQGKMGKGRPDVAKLLKVSLKETTVNAKVKTSWKSCYAYLFDSTGKNKEPAAWPGKMLSLKNGTYAIEADLSKYDTVVFAESKTGAQTVDLALSSFASGRTYSLTGAVTEVKCLVGKYVS